MTPRVIGRSFVHSGVARDKTRGTEAVVIHETLYYEDGKTEPNLRVFNNPEISFWVTKPQFRNHTDKKEREELAKLDQYICKTSELEREVFKVLNGYYPKGHVSRDQILSSPFIYGVGIDIQTRIKARYRDDFEKTGLTPAPATVGFLDIERSLLESNLNEITIINYTHENKLYTAILENSFYHMDDNGNRRKATVEDVEKLSTETLNPIIDRMFTENEDLSTMKGKLPIDVTYYVGKTELDLITWIFDRVHENKTAFVGIWNMDFDVPAIIDVIERNDKDPADFFCPPSLQPAFKSARYKKDKKQGAHLTDKWHWMFSTGWTQFYDATPLYAKLRVVKGKEARYTLDYILQINNIDGKLKFHHLKGVENLSGADWHRKMSSRYFLEYVVYGQYDVLGLQFLEWQNRDVQSMILLSDVTPVAKFPRQTVKVQDTLHTDWIKKGWVLGTPSSDMTEDYDEEISADGGAVLSALRMDRNGLFAIRECSKLRTQLHCFVNDVDFSGMYPNTAQAANISKETKVSTALNIVSPTVQQYFQPVEAVEAFFGYLACPHANAYTIGKQFFSFPTFDELEETFEREVLSQL